MDEKLLNALREIAHPLRTVVADDNFSDLQPLKSILQGVNIIGLGESTHGTREIFQLKHRLTRFLVEQMGFRVFTIEAGVEPCRNINDYVMMGKGDKHRALSSQGYWTWDTAEVMDMIDWMREHNLRCRRGDECQFLGYDMKPIEGACDRLLDYLPPLGGADQAKIEEVLLACRNTVWMQSGQKVRPDILWLLGWLRLHEKELVAASCPASFSLAVENATYIFQYMDCMVGYNENPSVLRDRDFYMAENVMRIFDAQPRGSKIIVWAHNGHIAVDKEWKNLGWELRQRYGSTYYPMAIGFGKGGFQSRSMPADDFSQMGALLGFSRNEPLKDSWDEDLDHAFASNHYLDLRGEGAQNAEVRGWMRQNKQAFSVGAGYSADLPQGKYQEYYCPNYVISEHFDGAVFLKSVQRARPNPNGVR